jgi:photosystem II stability/assembly factor-like uncharacterized protein
MSRVAIIVAAITLVGTGYSADQPISRAVTLKSTHGRCIRCAASYRLGHLQFVTDERGWAEGYYLPSEGNGSGLTTLLKTADGGRTWTPVSFVRQPGSGGEPSELPFCFANADHGWVTWVDTRAERHWAHTEAAGAVWNRGSGFPVLRVQCMGDDQLYAVQATRSGSRLQFATTADGGAAWTRNPIPLDSIHLMHFQDRRIGWLAGTVDSDQSLRVLRTRDGGATWAVSDVDGSAGAKARAWTWDDSGRGWLVVWLANDGGSRVFQTVDGGSNWRPVQHPFFNESGSYVSVVRFLGKTVIAFRETKARPEMLVTTDDGQHWDSRPLDAAVYDCQRMKSDLVCGAGMDILRVGVSIP